MLLILLALLLLLLVGASLLAWRMVRRRVKGELAPWPCAPSPGWAWSVCPQTAYPVTLEQVSLVWCLQAVGGGPEEASLSLALSQQGLNKCDGVS